MKKQIYIISILIFLPIILFGQLETKKSVYFATDISRLDGGSIKCLDSIATILSNQNDFTITLKGHTDDVGSSEYNDKLSEVRVISVKNYLISKGINEAKIISEKYGENNPIVLNNSVKNKSLNRRVEILIKIIQKSNAIVPIVEENKNDGWPPQDGILVEYGTKTYNIPGSGTGRTVEISVITNTEQMEAENFSTLTKEGEPLASNLIICVRLPAGTSNCNLQPPLKMYVPVNTNPYCNAVNVKYYDAENDSLGKGFIKWNEILPNFTTETHNGIEYFVIYARSMCDPCKNFDCPKLKTRKGKVKLKSKKYEIVEANIIHKSANALLPGDKVSRNIFNIQYFDIEKIDSPNLKIRIVTKRGKKYVIDPLLSELTQDKDGIYIVTKKMIKKSK
jgi:hypothetical protein